MNLPKPRNTLSTLGELDANCEMLGRAVRQCISDGKSAQGDNFGTLLGILGLAQTQRIQIAYLRHALQLEQGAQHEYD